MCAPLFASGVHMSGMHGWILSVRSSEMNKTDDTTSAENTRKCNVHRGNAQKINMFIFIKVIKVAFINVLYILYMYKMLYYHYNKQ